jgi:glycosyltransferase involved in cell wall biosynthesis
MQVFLFWLAVVTLVGLVATTFDFVLGNRRVPRLKNLTAPPDDLLPAVSIVIAARNEARNLEHALQSVMRLEYPRLEVIVVNDRSTDATGEILDRLAAQHPGLRVVHVAELPVGWLGKCHALHTGAAQATGDWLLFTDADVVMDPAMLRRAMGLAQRDRLDHLAVAPHIRMPGTLLPMFGGAFTLFFGMYARPWKAADPRSPRHIGIGAFNLVRAAAYRAVGGHGPIALRPDDDMKLGKLLKKHGCRQAIALGDGFITVEWYGSVPELVRGLEKNAFAGVEYNLAAVVAASVGQLMFVIWPFAALLVTGGTTFGLNAACVALMALLYADNAGFHGLPRWHWVAIPITALLFQYIIWRAVILTLLRDGIDWRGTHYPLAQLKANKL